MNRLQEIRQEIDDAEIWSMSDKWLDMVKDLLPVVEAASEVIEYSTGCRQADVSGNMICGFCGGSWFDVGKPLHKDGCSISALTAILKNLTQETQT